MADDSQFWTDNSLEGACAWTDTVTTDDAAPEATPPPHHCEHEEDEEPKPDDETERELERCKGGCGCYGTEANQGYCSKCTASGQDSDEQEQPGAAAAAPLPEEPLLMDADVMQAPHGLGWEAQQQPDNWMHTWMNDRPLVMVWMALLVATSAGCLWRPELKSVLCLHWASIERGEYYRFGSTFLCLGGGAIQMRGLLNMMLLHDTVGAAEQRSWAEGGGAWFGGKLVMGAALLLAMQYYGSHLHGYVVLGSVGSHLLYRQARWLSYDLSFLAMCTACWEHGSEPAVLSIGIPINLVQWQMPLAMSVIHMMLADGLQGVYLEALVASVVVHVLSQVGSKLFMDERPDHLQV